MVCATIAEAATEAATAATVIMVISASDSSLEVEETGEYMIESCSSCATDRGKL